jgi:hypothetical protein
MLQCSVSPEMTMKRLPNAFDLMRLSVDTTRMLAEAQVVIALRLMGMAGVIPTSPGENARMVSEKVAAVQAAGVAMARAAMGGASATDVAAAGLKHVGRRTRANVRRLSKPRL